ELTSKSKRRIVISSLYIGTGKLEVNLIENLKKTMSQSSNLNVTILMDYMRGNRLNNARDENSSTKALLKPLLCEKTSVAFYLSPKYSNWWRKYLLFGRQKWNEIISLQHIKCYIFDDNLIISGANLSNDYFTNRQDRYICFHNNKQMCDYFEDLIKVVSTFSMKLKSNGDFCLDSSWSYHPLNRKTQPLFVNSANKLITELNDKYSRDLDNVKDRTVVIPFLQMKSFNISDDEKFTLQVLKRIPEIPLLKLTTGYFNLTKEYLSIILNQKSTQTFDILMASEAANGFYGAKGIMGNIPSVYTQLAKKFMKTVNMHKLNIGLWSFNRNSWTFHAKGMWLLLNCNVFMTTIGSPNFGYRSVNRDLEAQIALITSEEELKSKLSSEYNNLWKYSQRVEDEKQLPAVKLWIRFFTAFVKDFF
ncbi:CDP-diacylglycerol--glycerol-3-phosphate 3-phosphatidyltransferase-like protein, partial [Leptotrombidium deliense]